jgi:aminopeptidase N
MENWGAIFYSPNSLLFDPAKSTQADQQFVFELVSHEMAHQWFGDLVTMPWWDDLWLNEGFARWMATKAADELHPQWKTGLQALGIAEAGKRADAKPSTHPIVQTVLDASQAAQAFDGITYDKGASVIGMLEAYVGPDSFRNGVRRYMRSHAYGNTVDADFWREIQAAAGKPILEIEADFTRQPGLPLLRMEQGMGPGGRKTVELRQGRFAEDPATIATAPVQHWRIPVTVSAGGERTSYLLSGAAPVTAPVRGNGPVIVTPYVLAILSWNHPDLTWKLALEHVDRPDFPLDSMLRLLLMPAIAGNSSDTQRIADLKAYADQHIPATARQPVEAAISSIELNAKFRAERIPEIDKRLAKKIN